jgi:hypothetical protein
MKCNALRAMRAAFGTCVLGFMCKSCAARRISRRINTFSQLPHEIAAMRVAHVETKFTMRNLQQALSRRTHCGMAINAFATLIRQ